MAEMITKKYGVDYPVSKGGALTLRREDVTEGQEESGFRYREHESGWLIAGDIKEDYFTWVNSFFASHPKFGLVFGDFEQKVYASSQEAFNHFWKHHRPNAWDYGDI
jgi:hypothetical protein